MPYQLYLKEFFRLGVLFCSINFALTKYERGFLEKLIHLFPGPGIRTLHNSTMPGIL